MKTKTRFTGKYAEYHSDSSEKKNTAKNRFTGKYDKYHKNETKPKDQEEKPGKPFKFTDTKEFKEAIDLTVNNVKKITGTRGKSK